MSQLRNLLFFAAILLAGPVFAETEQEIFDEAAVTCASYLAIAGVLTDVELSKMVFERDAKWWFSILAANVGKQQATERTSVAMNKLKDQWNNEEITWARLLEMGEKCSEMKLTLEGTRQ